MKIIITLCALAILASLISCTKSSDLLNLSLSSSHYDLKRDIAYGSDARQKLDIYYPNAHVTQTRGKDKPVIVFVYGGAWKKGDTKDFKFIAHAFTKAGYRVVIPNYRLYPDVEYPDFVNDVADAIAYIDAQSNTLLDGLKTGYVLMGHSAGAHTAALLATDQRYLNKRNIKAKLRGLVALAGPYDLPLDDPEVIPIFSHRSSADSVKPVRLVSQATPPTLLLHGQKDVRVGPYHTERFAVALKQADIQHKVKRYKKVGHVQIIASIARPLRHLSPAFRDIIEFLSKLK